MTHETPGFDFESLEEEIRSDALDSAASAELFTACWGLITLISGNIAITAGLDTIAESRRPAVIAFALSAITTIVAYKNTKRHFQEFIDTPVI